MKPASIYMLCVVLILAGCNRPPEPAKETLPKPSEQKTTPEVEQKVTFDAEKGLSLSDEVLKAQGVTFTNVESGNLLPKIVVNGQVYRAASEAGSRFGREKSGFAYVTALVDLASADLIKVGQEVAIDSNLKAGTVWRIERMQSPMTGKAEVLIELPDPDAKLTVGGFIPVTLNAGTAPRRGLVIPTSALLKTATGTFVYLKSGEHLLRKPVGVGITTAEAVEIVDGLHEGETIVTKPVQTLYLIELRAATGGEEE